MSATIRRGAVFGLLSLSAACEVAAYRATGTPSPPSDNILRRADSSAKSEASAEQ